MPAPPAPLYTSAFFLLLAFFMPKMLLLPPCHAGASEVCCAGCCHEMPMLLRLTLDAALLIIYATSDAAVC